MKRACSTNTNKYEDFSCEFHPTLEINYLRMKSPKLNLAIFLMLGFITLSTTAQEKKEQLWYCWEETVKPAYLDDYLTMSRELIGIYSRMNIIH